MLLLNMIEENIQNNDKISEKEENSKPENTVCNFEKNFPNDRYFVTNLLNQLTSSNNEYINICQDNLSGNKKQASDLGEEHMGQWTPMNSSIWLSNSSKRTDKPLHEEMLLDNAKKKKRLKDFDKLDLALDYTSCVNTDTFEYLPNSCFYIRFKNMVRGISDQNKRIRMNGFSQFIRGRMKTRADIVNECHEEETYNKASIQALLDEGEDIATHDHPVRRPHQPNRLGINKKSKDTSSSAPTVKHAANKINESLQERHKSNSASSTPRLVDSKAPQERVLNRERLKENALVKNTAPYVYIESTVKISPKGNFKTIPSIPSKNTIHTSNAALSCFGKSMPISSVLPPIAQKTSNNRIVCRKKLSNSQRVK